MSTVIQITNLSKIYRLGEIGTGTISHDLERWYKMKVRGQEDPFLKIGQTNKTSEKGVSDIVYSLRDINLEVAQGEALGIIGKNGAGKSTLLKILSRVTSPTTGKINIKGRVASLLEVGTGFHPELTGRENIYLNGAILGMRKNEITRKLDEIIDFSGVERYIDTPVKRYSSGMYVRLAFAVAAHLESEILIVDEVLAVGDAEFQKRCLGKMGDISKGDGRTILFVSHNMGQITKLCNRVILINEGRIIRDGYSNDIVEEYIQASISSPTNINVNSDNIIESSYVCLKSLLIYGENADRLPKTGSPLNIELLFDFKIPIANPGVKVFIQTLQGVRCFYLNSTPLGGLMLEKAKGKVRFKLVIDELLLTAGKYILIIGVNKSGQEDYITDSEVAQFEVAPYDYYSVGTQLICTQVGLLAAKHKWSYEKEA